MMDENTLREIFVAQATALHELRVHLHVIKKVLRERDLISDDDYAVLFEDFQRELRKQDRELHELNRLMGLGQPPTSEVS